MGKRPIISEEIKFIKSKADDLYEWATETILTGKKIGYTPYLTKEDTKSKFINGYPSLKERMPNYEMVVEKLLTNSSNYSVHVKFTGNFGKPKLNLILMDKRTEKEINTLTIADVQKADGFVKIINDTPQIYFGMLVEDILKNQDFNLQYDQTYAGYEKLIESLNYKN